MKSITLQEIKAQQISARQLYKMTEICSQIGDAINCEVRLSHLSEDYAQSYIKCAVDEIITANKRSNTMSEEEITDLANRIARRKRNSWTIYDVRMFTDLLIDGELIEMDSRGNYRGQLFSVDVASIMAKVAIYDKKRGDEIGSAEMTTQRESRTTNRQDYVPMPDGFMQQIMAGMGERTQDDPERIAWAKENERLYRLGVIGDVDAEQQYYKRIRIGYQPTAVDTF